jgi:hypothetical protein
MTTLIRSISSSPGASYLAVAIDAHDQPRPGGRARVRRSPREHREEVDFVACAAAARLFKARSQQVGLSKRWRCLISFRRGTLPIPSVAEILHNMTF